ncbi:hypothetical protein [Candidatus Hakubella thermalkaliphila]|nr:hypothetical protein [Candidatus Hakubella thermalkaliphila]
MHRGAPRRMKIGLFSREIDNVPMAYPTPGWTSRQSKRGLSSEHDLG